jgi:hypothetical protein
MPPLDFTSSENFVFVKQIELTSLTTLEHLLENSRLPLNNRSTANQKLRNVIEIERDARNHEILPAAAILMLC